MILKPQDVLVTLKIAAHPDEQPTYAKLGEELGMSASEAHAAAHRATEAKLLNDALEPISANLIEFLVHGVKYAFPAEQGRLLRGMPTAHAAPPLADELSKGTPPVWPDPKGKVRGESITPLYRSVVHAARRDPDLYRLLALTDALRIGRARERKLAEKHLRQELQRDKPVKQPGKARARR
ncbi:MAG: MarR family transcriptional regulator [Planctomycetota bacterium]|jgi:hypothetical protein